LQRAGDVGVGTAGQIGESLMNFIRCCLPTISGQCQTRSRNRLFKRFGSSHLDHPFSELPANPILSEIGVEFRFEVLRPGNIGKTSP
jgi:hypothetical protein